MHYAKYYAENSRRAPLPISPGHNYFLQRRGNGQERGPKVPFALIAAHRKQRLETGPGPGGDWGGVRGRPAVLINKAGLRTGHWTPTGAGPTQSLLLTVLVGNPTLSWGPPVAVTCYCSW